MAMICLDSDCIIDFLRNNQEAIAIVQKYSGELVTTSFNVFEVFLGVYGKRPFNKDDEQKAKAFFESLEVLNLIEVQEPRIAAFFYVQLAQKGKMIDYGDCFITAIMQVHGCNKIITRNVKHYSSIPGIQVISY